MSEKRRDKKGRILRTGESQRIDGRYVFKYKDFSGKHRYLYSNRLEKTDKVPPGGIRKPALRELEAELQAKINAGIKAFGGDLTVYELVEKYVSMKIGVRESTRQGYKTVLRILAKEAFGKLRIDKVKISDAKVWLIKLQQEDGRGYSSIHTIRGVLRPAFQMAVEDDLLAKNPFSFELHTVVVNNSTTRDAITRKQEKAFLEFIKNDKHFSKYYEGFFILFNTGLRISEFCGLTMSDIDFNKKCIHVTGQLVRYSNMITTFEPPKTSAGVRDVPMSPEVMEAFRNIMDNRKYLKVEPIIDGKAGFLYLDKNDQPMVAMHWQHYFNHVVKKYNGIYKLQLPNITAHVCRHTFCSKMAKSGMNPKTLQYIMGHSDISVTMNTYTHFTGEDAREEFQKLFGGEEESVQRQKRVW